MIHQDLEEVTSRQLRLLLEEKMTMDLKEYRGFLDQQMLRILGQMESPSQIFDYLYLVCMCGNGGWGGVGGATSSRVGGATSSRVGGTTSNRVGGATSSKVGGSVLMDLGVGTGFRVECFQPQGTERQRSEIHPEHQQRDRQLLP